MFTFLAIVHIVVSVLLVTFILLQDPKGGGGALGMLGGGGSKSLFGSTGGNQFLVNVTKWLALIFAFTSIYLAALSSQKDKSIMDDYIPSVQEDKADSENKAVSAESQTDESTTDKPQTDGVKEESGNPEPPAGQKNEMAVKPRQTVCYT